MTDSDVLNLADELERRMGPIVKKEKEICKDMHDALIDTFVKKVLLWFEAVTGEEWKDRKKVRDGIAFAIEAEAIYKSVQRKFFITLIAINSITVASIFAIVKYF